MSKHGASLEERFNNKYQVNPGVGFEGVSGEWTPCWEWTGSITDKGYGQLQVAKRERMVAHKISYQLKFGPLPDNMELYRLCTLKHCVNPDHVEPILLGERATIDGSPKKVEAIERFHTKYAKDPALTWGVSPTECWMWTGNPMANGTGQLHLEGKKAAPAHRFSYEVTNGPLDKKTRVIHLCPRLMCVNPEHLRAVSSKEFLAMFETNPITMNINKTHCPNGHPYDEENTVNSLAEGRWNIRLCKICARRADKPRVLRTLTGPERLDPISEFHKRYYIDESVGCWIWFALLDWHEVHGIFRPDRWMPAQEFAFRQFVSPNLDDKAKINQVCGNGRCVNPEHLEKHTEPLDGQKCRNGHIVVTTRVYERAIKAQECPECRFWYQKRAALKRLGLTLDEYDARLVEQRGLCAACGRPPEAGKSLVVDHDHETKEVIGLLHSNCNMAAGYAGEDTATVEGLLAYLKRTGKTSRKKG